METGVALWWEDWVEVCVADPRKRRLLGGVLHNIGREWGGGGHAVTTLLPTMTAGG